MQHVGYRKHAMERIIKWKTQTGIFDMFIYRSEHFSRNLNFVAPPSGRHPERQHKSPIPEVSFALNPCVRYSVTGISTVSQTQLLHPLYVDFALSSCWCWMNSTNVLPLQETPLPLLIRAWRIQSVKKSCVSECTSVLKIQYADSCTVHSYSKQYSTDSREQSIL
jgi:hypothetical protein